MARRPPNGAASAPGPRYWPGPRLQEAGTAVSAAVVGAGRGTGGKGETTVDRTSEAFAALVEQVEVPLPFFQCAGAPPTPSGTALAERWGWLAEVAAVELSVARLFEGHVDAVAILAEAGVPARPGVRYGVWASRAGGTTVTARPDGARLILDGVRPYASGAHSVDVALVTVECGDHELLVALDTDDPGVTVEEGSWQAIGMAASDSATVHLVDVAVDADRVIGPPGFYLARPGFWLGAIGVAACWFGGAVGVAQPLVAAAVDGRLDPHGLAALGRTWSDLAAAAALFTASAEALDDAGPPEELRYVAEVVRAVVERAAAGAVDAVGRSLGPGPLTGNEAHARRVADLGVYLRQHHAEADLAQLGRLLGQRTW